MSATTFTLTLSEDTALRFEETCASLDMEPSEVLCRLVRGFVSTGGFTGESLESSQHELTLEEQASEWKAIHEARGAISSGPSRKGVAYQTQFTRQSALESEHRTMPWEDLGNDAPLWTEQSAPKLPWED